MKGNRVSPQELLPLIFSLSGQKLELSSSITGWGYIGPDKGGRKLYTEEVIRTSQHIQAVAREAPLGLDFEGV